MQGGYLIKFIQKTVMRFREQISKFYAAEIALVLHYLHSLGIVLGNLSPEFI